MAAQTQLISKSETNNIKAPTKIKNRTSIIKGQAIDTGAKSILIGGFVSGVYLGVAYSTGQKINPYFAGSLAALPAILAGVYCSLFMDCTLSPTEEENRNNNLEKKIELDELDKINELGKLDELDEADEDEVVGLNRNLINASVSFTAASLEAAVTGAGFLCGYLMSR